MRVCGFYLTDPGGGGDLVIPRPPRVEDPPIVRLGVARVSDEFARKAQAAVDGGARRPQGHRLRCGRAYGGVPGEPEMTPEELAAVTVAHAAGHRSRRMRTVRARSGVTAGADTIEHASLIDDDDIARP